MRNTAGLVVFSCCFFQAEDGIRDLVRSRGLGDVYKRQIEECAPIAAALDAAHGGTLYRDALTAAADALRAGDGLPSTRVLATMARDFDNSHNRFVLTQSERTRDTLLCLPFTTEVDARFRDQTQKSIDAQQTIETMDTLPFEDYPRPYPLSARPRPPAPSVHSE